MTTDNAWTGANFRRGGYLDHADRYRRAEEFLTVARALWDSWQDSAVSGSAGAPAWAAPGAVRQVRHQGPQFDVDLAPTLPRSVQGHPVIFQAGDSGEGRDFAARNADVIFSAHGNDFDDALTFADDLRRRLRAVGRPDDDLRILPGTEIIIGATEQEALEKKRWIRLQQVTPATALGIAGLLWGIDLSGRDADGPLPKEDPVVAENDGSFGARRITDPVKSSRNGGRRPTRTAGPCARRSSRSAPSAAMSAPRRDWRTSSPTSSGTARSTASTSRRI